MDYYISHIGPKRFCIAKFDERRYPTDVYRINGGDCDCPSYRKPCKHIALIAEWLQQERPMATFFDDVAQRFIPLDLSLTGELHGN